MWRNILNRNWNYIIATCFHSLIFNLHCKLDLFHSSIKHLQRKLPYYTYIFLYSLTESALFNMLCESSKTAQIFSVHKFGSKASSSTRDSWISVHLESTDMRYSSPVYLTACTIPSGPHGQSSCSSSSSYKTKS